MIDRQKRDLGDDRIAVHLLMVGNRSELAYSVRLLAGVCISQVPTI
jgi:hypothetical protein